MQQKPATTIVGLDAHSDKQALCITQWTEDRRMLPCPKRITGTLDSLCNIYKKQVPKGALTIIEASTNAFAISDMLGEIGYKVVVVSADALIGRLRKDSINDNRDAEELAKLGAYEESYRKVHVPSCEIRSYRALLHLYQNSVTRLTRSSNNIWGTCSRLGVKLPARSSCKKIDFIKELIEKSDLTVVDRLVLKNHLEEYELLLRNRKTIEKTIASIVAKNNDMRRVMQVLGVAHITAFALVAHIDDIKRFENPKRLVGYIGLKPMLLESGKGKSPNMLTTYGIRYLKSVLVEGAKLAMYKGKSPMCKWARGLVARGKHPNTAACALARKMVTCVWHILMGHPVPNRELEDSYRTKLLKLASKVGKEEISKMGYERCSDFVNAITEPLYAHLAPRAEQGIKCTTSAHAY